MKPIALQLYSLRERAKEDLAGVLKEVAAMSYLGVEPAGMYGNDPKDVRKMLDDLELTCCSMHGAFPTKDTIQQRVDEAGALGTDMIISGGIGAKDLVSLDALKAGCDRLNAAAAVVADAGLRYGYHNHDQEFAIVGDELAYDVMMREVPGMFSQLDVYWAANFGAVDVPAVLARYAARIPLLHIKDGPLVKGEPHTAVGKGKMDIPAVIRAADPDVVQWLIVELDHCATDMTEAVADSARYLIGEGLGKGRD